MSLNTNRGGNASHNPLRMHHAPLGRDCEHMYPHPACISVGRASLTALKCGVFSFVAFIYNLVCLEEI